MADKNQPSEEWVEAPGYDLFYEVSNLGRVRRKRFRDSGPALQLYPDRYGYLHACFSVNNVKRKVSAHRLVARAFCHQPEGCDFVHHRNTRRDDNRAENLEWTTRRQNNAYAAEARRLAAA